MPLKFLLKYYKKIIRLVTQAKNILDPDFVIGIWASASRQKIRTLNDATSNDPASFETNSGDWVQVSRLGMPLTNEVVIPIGYKDYWNRLNALPGS